MERVDKELRLLMEKAADEFYETGTRPTMQAAYSLFVGLCGKEGLEPCVYKTFGLFLKKRRQCEQTRKRRGRKAAAAEGPSETGGPKGLARDGLGPCDLVHVDHTQVDVFLRVGGGAGTEPFLERPWYTQASCAWSRRVLGYWLSFDAPSWVSVSMVMRDLVRRNGCTPRVVMVDGGSEFDSVVFGTLCAANVMEKRDRPPGEPRYGAVCERFFGTTNKQFVHTVLGNTQNLKEPRAMSRDVDPRKAAVWASAGV